MQSVQPLSFIASWLGYRLPDRDEQLRLSEEERLRAATLVDSAETELVALMVDMVQSQPTFTLSDLQPVES